MKPENCKVGIKIERFFDSHNNVKKGSVYTVAGVNIGGESVRLKETNDNYWYDLNMFRLAEPVNQFEVGNEVIYSCYHCPDQIKHKSVIFGIKDNQYAIKYTHKSVDHYTIVKERRLSPLKKKDELKVGDKFKVKTAEGVSRRTNEVLGIFKDDYYNQTKYVAKRMNGNYEGFVDIYNSEMIAEIVYE